MSANADTIQKLYIAYFNRPADVAGLAYWEGQLSRGLITMQDLAQSFSEQVEYKLVYENKSTSDFVGALYRNLFAHEADQAGLEYWVKQIDSGAVRKGVAALAILNGAAPGSGDGWVVSRKLDWSTSFTAGLDSTEKQAKYSQGTGFEIARKLLTSITATTSPASLNVSKVVSIPDATDGINYADTRAGVAVSVDLKDLQTYAGYKVNLLVNGLNVLATKELTAADVAAQKVTVTVPAGADWGSDGKKTISAQVEDYFGTKGRAGGALSFDQDTTLPIFPDKYQGIKATTYWFLEPSSSGYQLLNYGIGKIQFPVVAGDMTGGYIAIQKNGTTILKQSTISAQDTQIVFDIPRSMNNEIYNAYYESANKSAYSFVMVDKAGNIKSTTFSDFFWSNKYRAPEPATNIKVTPVNGYLSGGVLSSSTTNVLVEASVVGVDAFVGRAILKLAGREIASDEQILVTDNKVTFNLGTDSYAQLKNLIRDGGELSVVLVGEEGNSLADYNVNSIDNPILKLAGSSGFLHLAQVITNETALSSTVFDNQTVVTTVGLDATQLTHTFF